MSDDEVQIRGLVERWHAATRAGDVGAVLALMTDDVVFLTPGRPPMSKADFAALSAVAPGAPRPRFEATQVIQEVVAAGSIAYMWSALTVAVAPPGAAAPVERSGHTLTVFRKVDGRWLLARDANLLTLRPPASAAQ